MAAPTLGGISLGKLQSINNDLNCNIIPLPLPTGASDETETFDMLGRLRTIALSGIFVGTTAVVKAAVESIEAIMGAEQVASVPLITDEIGTKQVKINGIASNWDVSGVSNRCAYRIICFEGT